MLECFVFAIAVILMSIISFAAAVIFSQPAPDWVDEDDRRRGWYK